MAVESTVITLVRGVQPFVDLHRNLLRLPFCILFLWVFFLFLTYPSRSAAGFQNGTEPPALVPSRRTAGCAASTA